LTAACAAPAKALAATNKAMMEVFMIELLEIDGDDAYQVPARAHLRAYLRAYLRVNLRCLHRLLP
jgi:hypothetical protein